MSILKVFLACAVTFSLAQATSYLYLDNGVKLDVKKGDISIYNGSPVEKISKKGKKVLVKISGYIGKDGKTLYATPNRELILASVKKANMIKKDSKNSKKGSVQVLISKDNLTDDPEEAWEENSDLFYDKCTRCHRARVVKKHTMKEWDVLFNSMKQFAKPTKKEAKLILRFLHAYAKDGILTQKD